MSKSKEILVPMRKPIPKDTSDLARVGHMPYINKNNGLSMKKSDLVTTPIQLNLYEVDSQKEFNGIEMGVLESGIPFLTERGLAKISGVDRSGLNRLSDDWLQERNKPRGKKIQSILEKTNFYEDSLFLKAIYNGQEINAYPEQVCMAIIEYYAFETEAPRKEAILAFRTLARAGFRAFIYLGTGYTPTTEKVDSWRHYHDRVDMTLGKVQVGYFSIFNEIASMIIPMIRSGITVNDKLIPDISVGKTWSSHWKENNFDKKHGARIKYPHEYPLYYPQAKSNPQPSFAYPELALADFREWFRTNYILTKFPKYILRQLSSGKVTENTAKLTLETFKNLSIE